MICKELDTVIYKAGHIQRVLLLSRVVTDDVKLAVANSIENVVALLGLKVSELL